MSWMIIRLPCLPEDEGRSFLEREEPTKEKAEAWVKAQEGQCFGPSDYKIVEN